MNGPGPRTRVISSADIARCPARSLSMVHYHDDGTCLCADAPPLTLASVIGKTITIRDLIKAAGSVSGDSATDRAAAHLICTAAGLPEAHWRSVLGAITASAVIDAAGKGEK